MTAFDLSPAAGAAPRSRALAAQTAMELRLVLRNGEQLLLTIIIPTVLLILFAKAPIADLPKPRIDFLLPGVLALAVMSTAFTGQAIGTGFERRYGVLRRLGTTPLTRAALLTAKTSAVIGVEILQIGLLCLVALALGWSPDGTVLPVIGLLLLGTAAFSVLGLLMAGTLRAEATLAAANFVYLVLLVLGGVAFPLADFSSGARDVLQYLPISALSTGLRRVLSGGHAVPGRSWLTLAIWAVIGGAAAARFFRWD
jgi:ABC-2 type transport system permease protein